MLDLNALRNELSEVLNISDKLKIDHHKIAKKLQYSYVYIAKVRAEERCTIDTKDNRDLIQSIISAYRKEIEFKLKDLEVTYKEIK